ncbi:unnamed protein product [Eruca vesicaria subsp. sativa]|uniref:Uncharacterized protein n=1 Tax=Eruca vesicaria subsp. sativa TaxID=29727 RepID=A0ABC8LDR6_ERUVS|nr:unnamed protein product [Eruca vesicaria subsp. sativa]
MESLRRIQTHRRQLDEEVERNTKDLTLVQNKLVECEHLLETRSLELFKTQDEIDCNREHARQMDTDLERCRDEVSEEKKHWERTQAHSKELEAVIEIKMNDLTTVLDKIANVGLSLNW